MPVTPQSDPVLARAFAVSESAEQAAMLDAMARELFVQCGGRHRRDSFGGYETQCCEITRKLGKDGQQFIKDLHAFIELRERDMA